MQYHAPLWPEKRVGCHVAGRDDVRCATEPCNTSCPTPSIARFSFRNLSYRGYIVTTFYVELLFAECDMPVWEHSECPTCCPTIGERVVSTSSRHRIFQCDDAFRSAPGDGLLFKRAPEFSMQLYPRRTNIVRWMSTRFSAPERRCCIGKLHVPNEINICTDSIMPLRLYSSAVAMRLFWSCTLWLVFVPRSRHTVIIVEPIRFPITVTFFHGFALSVNNLHTSIVAWGIKLTKRSIPGNANGVPVELLLEF